MSVEGKAIKVTHVNKLHKDLDDVIEGLKNGMLVSTAKQINNAAGKRIAAFRAQLEHSKLRKEKSDIAALK